MGEPALIAKLRAALSEDLKSESQVVYILVEIRKLIQLKGLKTEFGTLWLFSSWAVHPWLKEIPAQALMVPFERAHPLLKGGVSFSDLPEGIKSELESAISLSRMREQLKLFLKHFALPDSIANEGWATFLRFYALVVEDCPLIVNDAALRDSQLKQIVLNVDEADATRYGATEFQLRRLRWTISDRKNVTGELYSFFTTP